MTQTSSRQFRNRRKKRDEYGVQIERIDRRREVWKLRARGLSLRAIAAELNISLDMAWRDVRAAQDEWGEISESPEILRQQLLETHRSILGGLLTAFEREIQQGGQSTETYNASGELITRQIKSSPNVQLAAEAGRTVMRAAQLMGLIQTGPDAEANAQGGQQTTINLISPGSAAEFASRAQQLAAARAEPQSITVEAVQATPEPAPTAQEVPTPQQEPEPATEPSEPLWRQNLRARRRKAQEAAQSQQQPLLPRSARQSSAQPLAPAEPATGGQKGTQRPAVRFLAPPQRN